jgi:putative ABC transport system substrate-binding protein
VKRREFITLLGSAAGWPLAARAQQGRIPVIGILRPNHQHRLETFAEPFRRYMKAIGWEEGRNVRFLFAWIEGLNERAPALAGELVVQNVDLIVTFGDPAIRATQRATQAIPIVAMTDDMVGSALVASLARPGGNTTGIANLSEDVTPKVLEILRVVVPSATTIATLLNPANPSNLAMLDKIRAYAATVGATIQPAELKTPGDLETVFDDIVGQRPDALLVINDAAILDLRERVMALALQNRLPVASSFPELTDAGALVGYGPPRLELYRRSAYYVKRILDGAKPADLPVEQPTRIELSVNLKTAKLLGISLPDSLLARADRVVE